MNILAIDTASNSIKIALHLGDRIFESVGKDGMRNSENLMPLIDSLFSLAKAKANDLDLIAISKGPGSFTALRIGFSTAKGIAFGTKTPLVSVSTLDSYALPFQWFEGLVVPLMDARKKRFYSAIYKNGKKLSDDLDIGGEDLMEKLKGEEKILFTGPDSHLIGSFCEGDSRVVIDRFFNSMGASPLVELAKNTFLEKGGDETGSGPLYIRKSEAEISLYGE